VTGVPDGRNADNRRYFTRLSVLAFRETLATSILIDDAREMLSISKENFSYAFWIAILYNQLRSADGSGFGQVIFY